MDTLAFWLTQTLGIGLLCMAGSIARMALLPTLSTKERTALLVIGFFVLVSAIGTTHHAFGALH
jgi:hypothetical protein